MACWRLCGVRCLSSLDGRATDLVGRNADIERGQRERVRRATTWAAAKVPRACNVDAPQAAHQLAVPLVVTVPSVIATDDTLRPFGEAFAGEPNTPPAPKIRINHLEIVMRELDQIAQQIANSV